MDPLERGKEWRLARTFLLWMKPCIHDGIAALKSDRAGRLYSTEASKHHCPAQADPGSPAVSEVHPPATYPQLQLFLVTLPVEQKARGDVLHWATRLRWEGGGAETPALSAGKNRTGRRDQAASKPRNTHLLFFFPPQ